MDVVARSNLTESEIEREGYSFSLYYNADTSFHKWIIRPMKCSLGKQF